MAWWEFIIPFAVSLAMVAFFKLTIGKVQTADTEYWGGYVTKVQYFEAWDEWVTMFCTRQVPCGTDANNNIIYCTEIYDCSYEVDHPEEWHAIESNGFDLSISEGEYERLVRQFCTTPEFIDMKRSYYTNDGDLFQAEWDGNKETLEPATTIHLYENRVQAANSVFNFPDVDDSTKARYHLYDYPDAHDPFRVPGILGPDMPGKQQAEQQLDYLNATLGAPKKVRLWILVYMNQPVEAALAQEWMWKRGNKNEFILTIGVDDQRAVQWAYPISWTEVEQLKVDARYFVDSMKVLNLPAITAWLSKEIPSQWIKKDFREFNYLTLDPPGWSVAVTFIITLLANVGISWWAIKNEYTEDASGSL